MKTSDLKMGLRLTTTKVDIEHRVGMMLRIRAEASLSVAVVGMYESQLTFGRHNEGGWWMVESKRISGWNQDEEVRSLKIRPVGV